MPIPRPTRILPILLLLAPAACGSPQPRPSPEPPEVTTVAHVHSIEDALASFRLPEGYRVEVVAYEPMVQDPVAIDFDADGRMYVVEMRGYMPDISGENEDRRNGRIVVLEDTNWDGLMDRRTVFMDSLVGGALFGRTCAHCMQRTSFRRRNRAAGPPLRAHALGQRASGRGRTVLE